MPVHPYNEVKPRLGERVFVAPGAMVVGGVHRIRIGAGAVVSPGSPIPAHHLAMEVPARVARPLDEGRRALIPEIAARYVRLEDEDQEMFAGEGH